MRLCRSRPPSIALLTSSHTPRTYFRVPEPRGRTYGTFSPLHRAWSSQRVRTDALAPAGELDVLFHGRVSARKFASTKVDQFAQSGVSRFESGKEDKGEKEHIERVRDV